MDPSSSDVDLLAAPAPVRPRRRGQLWTSLVAAAAVLGGKAKVLLGLIKAVPLGKLAITSLSMTAMAVLEGLRYGWGFGVGFVLLILVHELGHGVAIRRAGLQAGWPVFIPFFGAMISLKGRPQTAGVDADISYAGPLAGTGAALVCVVLWYLTHSRLFLVLADTGFFLNLFNLTPIRPLDGGAVAEVLVKQAWILGAVLLGGLFLLTHSPQLLILGGLALFRGGGSRRADEVPAPERRVWAVRYFGLCLFLGLALYCSHQLLSAGLE